MNNLFNKNTNLTDKLPDLPEVVLDEAGTSKESERNKRMISLAAESTFDPSDSLFSTMDGESSAIIKLNPSLKRLEDCDSTMDGECSSIIKLNPPLKRLKDCDSTMDGECSAVIKPNPPLKRMKILDSTISTRSEVIVGNIHPSNMDDVEHLNNSLSNPGSPVDRSTPISDCDIAETEVGASTLENSPIQSMEVAEVVQEKESVVDKRPVPKTSMHTPPAPRNFL